MISTCECQNTSRETKVCPIKDFSEGKSHKRRFKALKTFKISQLFARGRGVGVKEISKPNSLEPPCN